MNPRILFFILIFSGLFHVPGLGQRLETKYPRTVETTSDSFSISFSNYPQWVNRYRVGNPDTIGPGTDGAVGLYAKIYSGKDSTRIDYTYMPYEQVDWINNLLILYGRYLLPANGQTIFTKNAITIKP